MLNFHITADYSIYLINHFRECKVNWETGWSASLPAELTEAWPSPWAWGLSSEHWGRSPVSPCQWPRPVCPSPPRWTCCVWGGVMRGTSSAGRRSSSAPPPPHQAGRRWWARSRTWGRSSDAWWLGSASSLTGGLQLLSVMVQVFPAFREFHWWL